MRTKKRRRNKERTSFAVWEGQMREEECSEENEMFKVL